MAFAGWPPEAAEFFEGLRADNTKAYWNAHKAAYEASVRAPMAALLSDLSGEFGPARIARPYRDMRFSAGKAPYKTEIYAIFDRGGYVNFSAPGLTAATGYFLMSPAQLDRYRQAVDREHSGAELAALVERLKDQGLATGGRQALKTLPRGYPKDHPRLDLLRCKGLICWQHWPAGPWLQTAEARDRVAGFLRIAAPLQRWLARNVGPA